MATGYASIRSSGPGYDLEAQYLQYGYKILPDPPGLIPFGKQGQPIPQPEYKSTTSHQTKPMSDPSSVNIQPFGHFVGTSLLQINQPAHLGINEKLGFR